MHVQHPFAGILQVDDAGRSPVADLNCDQGVPAPSSRRSFFRRALAAAAGVFGAGLLAGRGAAAQYTVIGPRGQESSITHWPRLQHGDRRITTYALGEEGSYRPPPSPPPRYTTYALGEEGHRHWPPYGGGGRYRPAPITTYALGEEGGGYHWRW
jgi:hypothetical protein